MRVPAALLAIPLLAGASAGVLLVDSTPERLIAVAAFAAVLCALAGAGFLANDSAGGVMVCVCAGAAMAGYSMGGSTTRALVSPVLLRWFDAAVGESADPVVLEGRLREDAALFPYGAAIALDVDRAAFVGRPLEDRPGGVRLVVGGAPRPELVAQWRSGRRLRVTALLRHPLSFDDPGVGDERRELALHGTVLTGSVKSAALVEILARGNWIDERAASARAWTRRVIARHVGQFDRRSAAVAAAILIGDRTGLSVEDERRLQQAGTYHVIAISGGNIAILTTILVLGGRLVHVPYRAGALACILILLFYGQVAGGAASVGRAITAATVFLIALIVDRRGAPVNVLSVAALLAIAARPATTVDGGFLLSFGATAGIILGTRSLMWWTPSQGGRLLRRGARAFAAGAAGLAAATVCAEIALAPIAASVFSRITFAGLVLNFAAIPLMTVVQCGSIALLAASEWRPAATVLGQFVHWNAWALVESATLVDLAPWVSRDVPPPAWWVCASYYSACGALLVFPRYRRPLRWGLLLAGSVIVSGAGPAKGAVPPQPRNVLRVVVLDVGQGDATVAVLPDGRAVLVDAGGLAGTTFEMGSRVVVPALRALGVRRLHALVLTHGDPDHVGGAAEVMRAVPVASVWEGVPVPRHPALGDLSALADSQRVAWRTVRPGDMERIGSVQIRVHHPPEPDWERQRVRNDDSVVTELRYGEVSILLPGDIGAEVERALAPRLSLAPLVVLKAPHHGSATSSSDELIDATHPSAVIFSAGRNNRFGHPAPAVVQRFARRGIEMFNTADDGAVFIETDGVGVEIRGWGSKRRLTTGARQEHISKR